jgi:hypothetical protein
VLPPGLGSRAARVPSMSRHVAFLGADTRRTMGTIEQIAAKLA